jgi:signal transduction histidine kinase
MTGAVDVPTVQRSNVLLVDDEPKNLLALEAALQPLNQTLVRATSGQEALRLVQTGDFAVVLLDVQMRELDGFETAKQMRAQERSRHTPIIFLTAFDTSEFPATRAYALGAVDYLIKPVPSVILRAKVAGFVELFQKTEEIKNQAERLRQLEREAAEARLAEAAKAEEARFRLMAEKSRAETAKQRDQLLAMLAHELRNPMAPLFTSVDLLRAAGPVNPTQEKALGTMDRQLRHLAQLTDALLEATCVGRGDVTLDRQRINLARLVRTASEDRRATLEQAGLTLTIEAPDTPVWHNGDPLRLEQVVHSLLDNAGRFTDRGGQVSVRLAVDRDHGEAVLTVSDTGIGIEATLLPNIFDVFVQGDRTLERTRGGLGLGLSVVKRLVEMHGGQVTAASNGLGQGSEFSVRLPVSPEPAALSAVRPETPSRKCQAARVLVIEDSPDAAASLEMLLCMRGHDVRVAHTGTEGVAAARAWAPDVVVCDIGLPELDGYGVARELRQDPTTARVRLLALTGYGTEEDRSRSREAGFDQHLVKPVDPNLLLDQLAAPRAG